MEALQGLGQIGALAQGRIAAVGCRRKLLRRYLLSLRHPQLLVQRARVLDGAGDPLAAAFLHLLGFVAGVLPMVRPSTGLVDIGMFGFDGNRAARCAAMRATAAAFFFVSLTTANVSLPPCRPCRRERGACAPSPCANGGRGPDACRHGADDAPGGRHGRHGADCLWAHGPFPGRHACGAPADACAATAPRGRNRHGCRNYTRACGKRLDGHGRPA